MIEKNENKTYCFDTLPFLRDVILFATNQALTSKEVIEKARQKQQDSQESVDRPPLSNTTKTKIIQCTDDDSTHAIAINENGYRYYFWLGRFLKIRAKGHSRRFQI